MPRQYRHGWSYNDDVRLAQATASNLLVAAPPAGRIRQIEVIRHKFTGGGLWWIAWYRLAVGGGNGPIVSMILRGVAGSYTIPGPFVLTPEYDLMFLPFIFPATTAEVSADWIEY